MIHYFLMIKAGYQQPTVYAVILAALLGVNYKREADGAFAHWRESAATALAAAEAHAFGVSAVITAGPKDWKAFGEMRTFLTSLPSLPLPALARMRRFCAGGWRTI